MSGVGRAAILLGVLLVGGLACGADATWVGSKDDNFWDPNNWSPKDLSGVLTIGAGSLNNPVHYYNRPGNTTFRPSKLNITASGNFTVAGGDLYPNSSDYLNGATTVKFNLMNVRSTTYIGKNGVGVLTLDGGQFLQKYAMYVGYGAGGNGTLNVPTGEVFLASRLNIGTNGGTGHVYLGECGVMYCPGNEVAYFQGLVSSGLITTDPGLVLIVDYQSAYSRTRIIPRMSAGATLPAPWDGSEEAGVTDLSWTSDWLATSNQVYFGTSATQVLSATTASTGLYLGSTTASTISLSPLPAAGRTYYWRVDTVKSTGTVKGAVWSFKALGSVGQRRMEDINRGVVAVKLTGMGVYVGWRVFGTDPAGIAFNVYRGSTKVNATPITDSTNYTDAGGSLSDVYSVRPVIDGQEKGCSETVSVWANQYLDIPVRQIPGDTGWTYTVNDGAVGDLDGDGKYEIVVKRLPPSIGVGNIAYIEAYRMDGTFMWRVCMGPNFTEWEEMNQIVYDFDGDGKAEVALKTSELTTFGDGTQIGDTNGDGKTDYSDSATYNGTARIFMTQGPEFLSILEGSTGRELARTDYIGREPISQWGTAGMNLEQLAHRSVKFHMTPAYLNGRTPSLVICRGIYHRSKMEAWNWQGGQLKKVWAWDSGECGDPNYDGQGNHNLSVGDVDQDGRDEIAYGGCVVDHNGKGLYSTGLKHGDAMHLSDMDPCRPGLEIWRCLETSTGAEYRDAKTGQILIQYKTTTDCGRACAGDVDPCHPGYELWAGTGCPLYSCDGTVINSTIPSPLTINYMIYWDGDLQRELLDHTWSDALGTGVGRIDKWYYQTTTRVTLLNATGAYSCNGTKGTPVLQADLLGDWREEVIWRTSDNRAMRLYTTIYPTTYRIFTLMHDPQYRVAVAWQVCGYNQPPHPGFYIGAGMTYPPALPNIVLVPNLPRPDISGDCSVTFADFGLMAQGWMSTGCGYENNWCGCSDVDHSGTVNFGDVAAIGAAWLECSLPVCF